MNNEDVIDVLNDLIENCRDGEYGFRACAEHTQSTELRELFQSRARECGGAAVELQALVTQFGGRPEDGGTASGAMHRGWVAVKGTLSGYTDLAMLEECERGEDVAKARYQKALGESLPPSVRLVVERQFQGAQRNHDQIRALRDRFRAAA
ncbi:PA2169 family four-helix-bundle protein [Aquabacterium fontiphilum]|jgi:uncharacterized protein (TIGR02284 family)|uniref:PA2169 family four-helix-bundle protein n=1 Tax=Aquabacterium fontiphilum TaxID=450365 RepID=UPI0013771188|nr:PA2169 family four-helix-bundle protein [Aquabacterium fontiphilum]NBD22127.1 PA2169 family four-helix-bundle protein [Aquabacterium fontiphilum]